MSAYAFPDLLESLSPIPAPPHAGQVVFNFTTVDDPLFAELARITQVGFERCVTLASEVAQQKRQARSH